MLARLMFKMQISNLRTALISDALFILFLASTFFLLNRFLLCVNFHGIYVNRATSFELTPLVCDFLNYIHFYFIIVVGLSLEDL